MNASAIVLGLLLSPIELLIAAGMGLLCAGAGYLVGRSRPARPEGLGQAPSVPATVPLAADDPEPLSEPASEQRLYHRNETRRFKVRITPAAQAAVPPSKGWC